MATFQPDKDFEKQIAKAIQPQLDKIERDINRELQRKVSTIERTHAGRPEREVLMALERAYKSVGVQNLDRAQLAEQAKAISQS